LGKAELISFILGGAKYNIAIPAGSAQFPLPASFSDKSLIALITFAKKRASCIAQNTHEL
jgi:hypothetical protein